ncbi:MAG TPA: CrcB family protein [Clostridia bacterium]|nr:CrcB family protein [Clostridia bacterium]
MRRYIYIGIGAFLGAIARYVLKNWQFLHVNSPLRPETIIINITGCFILAFFLGLAFDIWELDPDLRLGTATGFIGAFTTFSTLCRDSADLLLSGYIFLSAVNLLLSVAAGLTAVYLGDISAKKIIALKEQLEDSSKN